MKWLLPLPLGPHTTSTWARSTDSSVRSACRVGLGIAEAFSSHASTHVVGRFDGHQWGENMAASGEI